MADLERTVVLLYLHIPFCHRICPYCSFYKHTPGNTPIADFVDALLVEMDHRLNQHPRTIYLGGGTPSMLSPRHLEKLFQGLHSRMNFREVEEVAFEANPATFDLEKAFLFKSLGITRVSLGIQSFTPHVLATLGREHSREQAVESVTTLREAGIHRINIDLMFSVPGQSERDWLETLSQTLHCQPDHISAYNLTYEEDTAFFEMLKRGDAEPSEDVDSTMFHHAHDLLTGSGFVHYETSKYARENARSTHNEGYWKGEDYLGVGPSAVSTLGNIRTRNIPDSMAYVQRIEAHGHAVIDTETLDEQSRRIERIALGLRTEAGIDGAILDENGMRKAETLVSEGLARWHKDRLSLIGRGRALVDAVALDLL